MPRIARPPARAACVAASGVLVAGTAVLAFRSGFEEARTIGGIVAWALAAILVLVLPRDRLVPPRAGIVALAGLVLLTVWTAIAKSWAPLPDLAGDDLERLLVYLGVFITALLAFSEPAARRWLEPGLALLAVAIIGYGLAGRFFPDELNFTATPSAAGRLDQPLTYWNAMGSVAATGLVLAVSIAGDPTRRRLRIAAGAVMPLLGLGLYLTLSRGAVLAAALGLAALLCLVPRRSYLIAAGIGVAAAVAAALVTGGDPEREGTGLMLLAALLCALAGVATWRAARGTSEATAGAAPRAGRRAVAALAGVALLLPLIGAPLHVEAGDAPSTAGGERFRSVSSARYAYWRVALESIPDHPLKGIGPGGYRVLWMKERPIDEAARDAHSLQLETAAELGLPGLGFLALWIGGTLAGAASSLRRAAGAVAGSVAALLTWTVSASVDWMWELPAVALIGLLLSAALVSSSPTTPGSEAGG